MKELNFKQELTAAFGQPISENPTQVMVEAAYRHHNLDWRYLTIEVGPDDLEAAVKGAKVMGFQGFNCTIPHKVKVIEYLDGLGQSASTHGCRQLRGQKRRPMDWRKHRRKGFRLLPERAHRPIQKESGHFWCRWCCPGHQCGVALAGASHITIVNRSAERGEELTKLLQDKLPCYADFVAWESTYSIPEDTDVVINATSIGLFPDIDARLDFDLNTLTSEMVVADVIPNPHPPTWSRMPVPKDARSSMAWVCL